MRQVSECVVINLCINNDNKEHYNESSDTIERSDTIFKTDAVAVCHAGRTIPDEENGPDHGEYYLLFSYSLNMYLLTLFCYYLQWGRKSQWFLFLKYPNTQDL